LAEVEGITGAMLIVFALFSGRYNDLVLYEKIAPKVYNFKKLGGNKSQKEQLRKSVTKRPGVASNARLAQLQARKKLSDA